MELFTNPFSHPSIGVTLVSATDLADANRIAGQTSSRGDVAHGALVERPGIDSGEFAMELAEHFAREADDGCSGLAVVALEPTADVMEIALMLEHICDRRHPGDTTIGIIEVVAVSSIEEILTTLCTWMPHHVDGADLGVAERLACRLEFASEIVLTAPTRPTSHADRTLALDLLRRLAPTAAVRLETDPRRRSLPPTPSHRRAHRLAASLGWQTELAGTSAVRTEPSGIGSFVFRDPRPFHPGRLDHAVSADLVPQKVGRIIRSRGLVRLASRPHRVGSWSIAGDVLALDPTSMMSWDEESPIGQEVVFVGLDLDHEALTEILGACLLTPEEFAAGPLGWTSIHDPFPQWTGDHEQSGGHQH